MYQLCCQLMAGAVWKDLVCCRSSTSGTEASELVLSEKDSACAEAGLLPVPTSAYSVLSSLSNVGRQLAGLHDLYLDHSSGAAAASAPRKKSVQVALTGPGLASAASTLQIGICLDFCHSLQP
jgi:hypothetical protein